MDEKSTGLADGVTYVLAVSGGIDSVVLLHILAQRLPAGQLVVAHFDHGVRPDSADDRLFVERLARIYGLAFMYEEGRLGAGVSEADARDARYAFLRRAKDRHGAQYIVTAHHADDVLETAILNLLRGTGRKGLSSLRSHGDLYRPLLPTPKEHIRQYARRQRLQWHEDSTNASTDYLRNYIRQNILPKFDDAGRRRLRQLIASTGGINNEIDALLTEQLQPQLRAAGDKLDRQWFIMLPHAVGREVLAAWLRRLGIVDFDRKLLERLAVAAKTFAAGKQIDINGRYVLIVQQDWLALTVRD